MNAGVAQNNRRPVLATPLHQPLAPEAHAGASGGEAAFGGSIQLPPGTGAGGGVVSGPLTDPRTGGQFGSNGSVLIVY